MSQVEVSRCVLQMLLRLQTLPVTLLRTTGQSTTREGSITAKFVCDVASDYVATCPASDYMVPYHPTSCLSLDNDFVRCDQKG